MPHFKTLSIEHRLNEDSNIEIWGDNKVKQVVDIKGK